MPNLRGGKKMQNEMERKSFSKSGVSSLVITSALAS